MTAKKKPKCGVCGRILKNEESIKKGIGPVCLSRLLKEQFKQLTIDYENL